ncbi:Clr6 histone deacetylase associated PHD protein-2 Cph2 [Ciborinia camelliae]|nr:Clr6 histone deacetylase associated PHD protein-2 Cph2 [Ciborinia camelliae]
MASVVCQKPAVDYSTFSRQQTEQSTSPFNWDSEPALVNNSDSCDSILPSPTSSNPIFSKPSYILPKEDSFQNTNRKSSTGQAFDFGTFEDWMRWDDPSDAALSPTSGLFPDLKIEPLSPNMSGLELSRNLSSIDEAAVFGDDNLVEAGEQLFQPTPNNLMNSPIIDIPSREGLYSTPLSWARPQINSRINPTPRRAQTIPQPQQQQPILYSRTLTPQEEIQLRAIAMPQQAPNLSAYATSPTSSRSSPSHSPISRPSRQSMSNSNHPNNLKRKSSACSSDSNSDGEDEVPVRHPPIKKTAHNMIEKRYRTNLNDKIAMLRDSVPSLRVMTRKFSRGQEDGDEHINGDDEEEDLQGLTPAHKLNKATVLSKATEYINHLEKRNKYLQKENVSLKSRIEAFEMLVMSSQTPNGAPQQPNGMQRGRYGP